jgi:hypothetical protein
MLLVRNLRNNTQVMGAAPVTVCYYKRNKPTPHEVGIFLEKIAQLQISMPRDR